MVKSVVHENKCKVTGFNDQQPITWSPNDKKLNSRILCEGKYLPRIQGFPNL